MRPRVTVVGGLNMDLVVRTPRIPEPGETIIGSEFATVPGGKGANQAVAAARLGARVAMVGRVGNDTYGRTLVDGLAAEGMDVTFVSQDAEAATGVALIFVADDGQNSIVVASGANARLSPADVDAAAPAITQADALILQLESPVETVLRAAQLARAKGVKVVLNPAPARKLPTQLTSLVDILIPNETETQLLTGLSVVSQAEQRAAARALHSLGVDMVVITLGARGALVSDSNDGLVAEFPAFEITAVDTTAAGDAFVAGVTVAMAEGRGPHDAVRWGNAAGALAATRFGAQSSLPNRREVETVLRNVAGSGPVTV